MKQFTLFLSARKPLRYLHLLILLLFFNFKSATAHSVIGYTASCTSAGQSLTIGVATATTSAGTYLHWQYRVTVAGSTPGAWIFLTGVADGSPINNTINGTVFAVSNANIVSPTDNYSFNLIIANAGTALNNVEFRLLVGPFGDPETVLTPVWNGDDQAIDETKTIRVRIRPATENCFTGCSDNMLVTNPPSTLNTPINEYYGGFETAANFGGTNANGSSITAQTDLNIWASSVPDINSVGVTNNAYAMIWQAARFAPRSGNNMLVAYQAGNDSKVWYKTLVAPSAPSQQYFGGQLTFRVWATKTGPNAEAPCFALELKGTDAANVTTVLNTVPVTMTLTAGQPGYAAGDWVQYSLSYFVPLGTYTKLEVSVRGNCTTATNFALDDICLIAPSAAVLPVTLSSFTGAYMDGVSNLLWTTEYESNSDYFEVLYSNDGVNFTSAGKINAAGNSSRQLKYTFEDNKAAATANYYRLKMVDKDGRFVLSNILILKGGAKGLLVTRVFPTPFTDNINLSVASKTKAQATIKILDNAGRVLVSQANTVNKGVTLINVSNLAKLSRGIYILQVQAGDEVFTQKLIK